MRVQSLRLDITTGRKGCPVLIQASVGRRHPEARGEELSSVGLVLSTAVVTSLRFQRRRLPWSGGFWYTRPPWAVAVFCTSAEDRVPAVVIG